MFTNIVRFERIIVVIVIGKNTNNNDYNGSIQQGELRRGIGFLARFVQYCQKVLLQHASELQLSEIYFINILTISIRNLYLTTDVFPELNCYKYICYPPYIVFAFQHNERAMNIDIYVRVPQQLA